MPTATPAFDTLSPTTDLYGKTIAVGDTIRSFDAPMIFADGDGTDRIIGMDTTGDRACFCEGVVEAIGADVLEGCPRYRIRVTRRVIGGEPLARVHPAEAIVYPPVNGTPQMFSSRPTCGVVAVR